MSTLLMRYDAKQMERIRMFRLHLKDLTIDRLSLGETPGTVMRKGLVDVAHKRSSE